MGEQPKQRKLVRYELRRTGPRETPFVIERVEEIGRFATREDARQYMIDTTEQRKRALDRV